MNKETVSEEQVLFNKLKYDDKVLIINFMKTLQPEEKKIPEKLYKYKENDNECCFEDILEVYDGGECEITEDISFIVDKINEIIDYLKSKGE